LDARLPEKDLAHGFRPDTAKCGLKRHDTIRKNKGQMAIA
jgi:hypothetical protein